MIVKAIRTPLIAHDDDLLQAIEHALPQITDKSVIAVTSKIISICEGSTVPLDGDIKKEDLISKEADATLPQEHSKYGIALTIKNHTLIASAGIDESNGNGHYILWPRDAFASARTIWEHLTKETGYTNIGVIITDSHTVPLRWGTRGIALAWCSIKPLLLYKGKSDLFGRPFRYANANILDGLAAAAVLAMGEGAEQTPIAVISDIPMVDFTGHPPTEEERKALEIEVDDDIYAPLLSSVSWKKRSR